MLSLPIPLREMLAAQPELVAPVLQVVQRVVARHLLDSAQLGPTKAMATPTQGQVGLSKAVRDSYAQWRVSEGWIKAPAGRTVDREGRRLLVKLKSKVEAYYR